MQNPQFGNLQQPHAVTRLQSSQEKNKLLRLSGNFKFKAAGMKMHHYDLMDFKEKL